jgi:fructose-1,6-bisphosphatase/sedoheptulose 1,7-bisphosphatase-like protein
MKNQVYNQGELQELKVMIEAQVVESVKRMAENQGISVADLVVIALRRYRSAHSDVDTKPKNK